MKSQIVNEGSVVSFILMTLEVAAGILLANFILHFH